MNLPDEPDFPISPIVRLRMISRPCHDTKRKVNNKVYQSKNVRPVPKDGTSANEPFPV